MRCQTICLAASPLFRSLLNHPVMKSFGKKSQSTSRPHSPHVRCLEQLRSYFTAYPPPARDPIKLKVQHLGIIFNH
jgi:hypothetical protein